MGKDYPPVTAPLPGAGLGAKPGQQTGKPQNQNQDEEGNHNEPRNQNGGSLILEADGSRQELSGEPTGCPPAGHHFLFHMNRIIIEEGIKVLIFATIASVILILVHLL